MLSAWLSSVPQVSTARCASVRRAAQIFRHRGRGGVGGVHLALERLNSASVMSLVQHMADAGVPGCGSAGVNGCVHLAASSGIARMLVVVCRSHCECRQTSCRSLVKVTSHSRMPAPMRAAARYDSLCVRGTARARRGARSRSRSARTGRRRTGAARPEDRSRPCRRRGRRDGGPAAPPRRSRLKCFRRLGACRSGLP